MLFRSVDRVDYGDYSPANQSYTGYVFVHFIEIPEVNREWINNELCSYGHCRIQIAFDEFWMLIPNKNPIPTTHLNIHQLADIVNKQNDRISTLETMVHYLQTQIESRIPSHSIFMTDTNSLQDVGQNFSPTSVSQSDDDNDYTGMPALIPVYVTPDSSVVNV